MRIPFVSYDKILTFSFLQCHFTLDIEPPIVKQCPGDIVREEEYSEVRVEWTRPVFSDNSGSVFFSANRQSGDLFEVPGTYQIVYTANDPSYNQNRNCSFTITLKSKFYSYVTKFSALFHELQIIIYKLSVASQFHFSI